MIFNPITLVDGYKLDHRRQYPPHTSRVYSNWTARSTYLNVDEVVFFGLQGALQEFHSQLQTGFFNKKRDMVVKEYQRRLDSYLGSCELAISVYMMAGIFPLTV